MSEKSRPYIGKDGNKYSDVWERDAANRRYEQQERLIEEQRKTNKLIEEENERIRNGGQTDFEYNITTGIKYAQEGQRITLLSTILGLIISLVLIFSGLHINIGMYILSITLLIEAVSVYKYNKKNNICHFFEISLLIISIVLILITKMPISMIKPLLPIEKSKYTISRSLPTEKIYNNDYKVEIKRFGIDGFMPTYENREDLDINKNIQIKIEYKNKSSKINQTKTINFNPREYFNKLERKSTINDLGFNGLYIVSIYDIFEAYEEE